MKICSCCGQVVPEQDAEKNRLIWGLLETYYELGDGIVWAIPHVGFRSSVSAEAFQERATLLGFLGRFVRIHWTKYHLRTRRRYG